MKVAHRVRDNLPVPRVINNTITHARSWAVEILPQYGELTKTPIIVASGCGYLQLLGCVVESTNRCANDPPRNHSRDSLAGVGTGCIAWGYLRRM